ncbi:MAG: aminopeptidase [Christensenellales bacterium]|jgi:aminopeptidase
MKDPRILKLAGNLINYSCSLQEGEHILIENFGVEMELVKELVTAAYKAGGHPHVILQDNAIRRRWLMEATEETMRIDAQIDLARMKQMDAYIGLRSGANSAELSDVPSDKMQLYMRHYSQIVHSNQRVPHTKWVVLRYPSPSMAQQANMSTDAFEDYYFDVCCLDYSRMDRAMDALVERMAKTDKVRLVSPGTDIEFSIKGIPAIKCAGHMNIPDGEIFTAPVKDSVNGRITYNTPSLYNGFTYENISLLFKDGKIVEASSNDDEKINEVLDIDEGARYIGEFAIGVNPYINHPMKDTLFDEKIAGSIHFTPGNCYDEAPNGNKSALHWDLVLIQTPQYGGGEMYFDGELVRKDGLFVADDLKGLNPENLK